MKIAIVDYGSGNLHSAHKAFERGAREAGLRASVSLSSDPDFVSRADAIVLPGVGAFADCRRGLDAVNGMVEALNYGVHTKARPFFGICVGMQLMATRGLEYETTQGLNWIKGDVVAFQPDDENLKIPHMGWNTLERRGHPLLNPIAPKLHAYFVHSYHMVPQDEDDLVATAQYGGDITAFVARDNMIGTQFHPEKSQTLGLNLIANFLKWRP